VDQRWTARLSVPYPPFPMVGCPVRISGRIATRRKNTVWVQG
jgi:hypothetical protein